MKKAFTIVLFLYVLYFTIQILFNFFGSGHNVEYTIKTDDDKEIKVKEKYVSNTKNEIDNYYFEIIVGETTFALQTFENMGKASHVIKEIKYFNNGNNECIFPIFSNRKIVFDVMCIKNNVITYYHNTDKKDEGLNIFVNNLTEYGYDKEQYTNNRAETEARHTATLYTANIQEEHTLFLKQYLGVYIVGPNKTQRLNLFMFWDTDVYKQPLSGFTNKHYIVANYGNKNEINSFYVVNGVSNKQTSVGAPRPISFNSYIQGNDKHILYVFDRDNKIQYEINADNSTMIEVGNEQTGYKYFENGVMTRLTYEDMKQDRYFKTSIDNDYENSEYTLIEKVGNKLSGFYYLYKKEGTNFKVYRANVQNPEIKTYLFTASQIKNVQYLDNFIYFVDGENIHYYSDHTGYRTIINDRELRFNDTLEFYVF